MINHKDFMPGFKAMQYLARIVSSMMTGPQPDEAQMKPSPILPLTDECHHYKSKTEVPWDLQK